MAKFIDVNKATWDVRTTSVQTDNDPAKGSYVATIDNDVTELDYSGNQFALQDSDTLPAGTKITWPANGNPMLKGNGGEAQALAAIRAFAARLKSGNLAKVAVIKVRASPPPKDAVPEASPPPQTPQLAGGGEMLAFLALVALVYYADKR